MDATAMIGLGASTKTLFLALTALGLTLYKWPSNVVLQDAARYDYIVVGAGTAGSIIAHRLSEDFSINVLLIEAGDDPQLENQYASLFPYLPKTHMDWNYTAENDGYIGQYHRNKHIDLTSGKVLGGSSSIQHVFYIRGAPYDYDVWAKAAGDDSWTWWNLLPYFKKSERLEVPDIIDSNTANFHGMDGLVGITKETRTLPLKYLEAFHDVGHEIKNDLSTNDSLGFGLPFYYISNEIRQSSAECFLATAKNRPNLHLAKKTLVRKIIFDGNLKAIGVECITDGKIYNVYTRKEIILSAGALSTPKILMLSGIGPKDHLESVGIPVLLDSPVGENLMDHVAIILAHKLEKTNDTVEPENPGNFPVPAFIGSGAINKVQNYGDWTTLNAVCRNNPSALLQLSTLVFGLNNDVCNQLAAAGTGREILFTVFNKARPTSTGRVLLQSADPKEPQKIFIGHFSNNSDLEDTATYIQDFIRVTNSSYFKKVGGETIYFDLPACKGIELNTQEYWKCYSLNMMDTTFHYSGTCKMGSVVDSKLQVIGTQGLRVGDASIMPGLVTGTINTAVMAIGEKLADIIKLKNSNKTLENDSEDSSQQWCIKKIISSIKKPIELIKKKLIHN